MGVLEVAVMGPFLRLQSLARRTARLGIDQRDRYLGGVFWRRALSSSSPTSRNVPASAAPNDLAACLVVARTSGSLAATSSDAKNFSVACPILRKALLISAAFVSLSASL